MAITRKPKTAAAAMSAGAVSEKHISQLISKGGSVAKAESNEDKQVLVRIPKDLLEQIDVLAQSRRIRTPRNTWIVEALFEKVEKES